MMLPPFSYCRAYATNQCVGSEIIILDLDPTFQVFPEPDLEKLHSGFFPDPTDQSESGT